MKKTLCALLAIVLCAVMPISALALETRPGYDWEKFKNDKVTLNVYNWGLYISDGTDDAMDVIKEFEALTGIRVVYNTYDTNESLYSKLRSGGGDYDIIIPSDYMIGKMRTEGMLEKLNFANIPNYSLIGKQYKGRSYDPKDEYCVPYTWGLVGIVYNTTMVDEKITSWNSLWDERYANNILMFNNSRDAYAIAAKKLGMSMNPSTPAELKILNEELKTQKHLVSAYVMDEIFDKMGGGEAALAPYYAGDAMMMIKDNPDLAFCIPEEGTNYFVDAMCIPKGSRNKEAAEMFINFMCETDVALANCEFIGYSTPQLDAMQLLPDEIKNSPIAYPSAEVLEKTETMNVLSDEMNTAMDLAWSEMKSFDENGNGWLIPVMLGIMLLFTAYGFYRKAMKRRRNQY
ncbi:MAG: spermidine/putrescine ABC transporter substrate-binding protein [Oscillospiraceae bacterium]